MSLIGSLEDLGLGDILQIIHLSKKSGVLSLRGDGGEGLIVFHDGMVRLASLKGGPEDLRTLLVAGGFVGETEFESATKSARESGAALSTALAELEIVSLERIDSLRRECAEKAVGSMFSWNSGEFSFDVGAEDEFLGCEMSLSIGVNTQYMVMESLRIWDERGREKAQEPDKPPSPEVCEAGEPGLHLELSAQEMFGVPESVETTESMADASTSPELEETRGAPALSPVIVIDASLPVLEWAREALAEMAASVHVFQRSQEGLGRIRQYLARAQAPILLISPQIEGDPLSGIVDAADYVRRLREQAPRMPIAWLVSSEAEVAERLLPVDLPTVVHPSESALEDPDALTQQKILAQKLILTLAEESARRSLGSQRGDATQPESVGVRSGGRPTADLVRLKAATQSLSDASSRGEILPLVIRFAAESFERVAMFMVRGEQILGMAQQGMDSTGGPNDVEMRALRFLRSESSWFSEVIETGIPIRSPVRNAGDQRLCDLLCSGPERNAYVAPVVSHEQVVALLYADKGPSDQEPGDASALEVILHQAGLALDRAALERALAEVDQER